MIQERENYQHKRQKSNNIKTYSTQKKWSKTQSKILEINKKLYFFGTLHICSSFFGFSAIKIQKQTCRVNQI
jgi:hypothetical protein